MPPLVLAAVLLVTALVAVPGAAEAGSPFYGPPGQTLYQGFEGRPTPWTAASSRKHVSPFPHDPRFRDLPHLPHDPRFRHHPGLPHDPRFRHHRGVKPPPSRVIIVPRPVYVVPSRCWVPGYWTYQWVPQSSAHNVWVPGQWSPGGTWIEGRWETRVHGSGYYQPYWVEGYYAAC